MDVLSKVPVEGSGTSGALFLLHVWPMWVPSCLGQDLLRVHDVVSGQTRVHDETCLDQGPWRAGAASGGQMHEVTLAKAASTPVYPPGLLMTA